MEGGGVGGVARGGEGWGGGGGVGWKGGGGVAPELPDFLHVVSVFLLRE